MIFRRNRRRKIFTFKEVTKTLTRKSRRILTIRKKQFQVFNCGDQTVVYDKDKVVFNSAIDDISYSDWLNKVKR